MARGGDGGCGRVGLVGESGCGLGRLGPAGLCVCLHDCHHHHRTGVSLEEVAGEVHGR